MHIRDAEPFVGHRVVVKYLDRNGDSLIEKGVLEAIEHAPMYGSFLYLGGAEISLDRVVQIDDDGQRVA